jgi:hypothetical protein
LIAVAVRSLLTAVCLTGIAGLAVAWGASGRVPPVRAVLHLAGHRVHPLWGWSAVVYAGEQALQVTVPSVLMGGPAIVSSRYAMVAGASLALLAWAVAVFMGVLGPVVLFERGRGPRRALHLLLSGPRGPVLGLILTSAALIALPFLVRTASPDAVGGAVLAAVLTVIGTLGWAVSAVVTYAASGAASVAGQGGVPGAGGPVTSASLHAALAAEEA